MDEARQYGLSAIDALHVAAAKRLTADELITTERATTPIHRVGGLVVTTIQLTSRTRV